MDLESIGSPSREVRDSAQSLGLSYHTINPYVDYLVGAFLIRRLPPFEANLGKRLVRSPKRYVRDSGLLHALLNVPDSSALLQQPWVGASWEGYVTERWAIDVKLTGSPSPADMEKLDRAADVIGATRRYLVSQTPRSAGTATRASCDLSGVMDRLTS